MKNSKELELIIRRQAPLVNESLLKTLLDYYEHYNIDYVIWRNNEPWFIASQLSAAKGQNQEDFRQNYLSERMSAENEQISFKELSQLGCQLLEGKELTEFRRLYYEQTNKSLGAIAPREWICNWECTGNYLSEGNADVVKEFSRIGTETTTLQHETSSYNHLEVLPVINLNNLNREQLLQVMLFQHQQYGKALQLALQVESERKLAEHHAEQEQRIRQQVEHERDLLLQDSLVGRSLRERDGFVLPLSYYGKLLKSRNPNTPASGHYKIFRYLRSIGWIYTDSNGINWASSDQVELGRLKNEHKHYQLEDGRWIDHIRVSISYKGMSDLVRKLRLEGYDFGIDDNELMTMLGRN
ncbi:hypothetical protein IQ238_16820 [Pleurocapsales cyanobacterium LEGE 06147]|nr:hypothetical protein [Pleurocapsales cyanobacterium LEGE 06147]